MDAAFSSLCSGSTVHFAKDQRRRGDSAVPAAAAAAPIDNSAKAGAGAPDPLDFFGRTAGKATQRKEGLKGGAARAKPRENKKGEQDGDEKEAGTSSSASEEGDEQQDDGDGVQLFTGQAVEAVRSHRKRQRSQVQAAATKQILKEQVAHFRRRLGITVHGSDVADPMESFEKMPLPTFDVDNEGASSKRGAEESSALLRSLLLRNIEKSLWKEPTPIQMQAIPVLLEGRDVIAAAPTGSGKTAAFVLPTLARLKGPRKAGHQGEGHSAEDRGIRAVLLSPTRELSAQIFGEVVRLCAGRKFKICHLTKDKAAAAVSSREKSALDGFDVLVATPMRLVSVMRDRAVNLSRVEIVVLDEADKLFDTGKEGKAAHTSFIAQVDEVLAACSAKGCQRALFSATLGEHVRDLATSVLRDAVHITVGTGNAAASTIDQKLTFVGSEEGKLVAIRQLVQEGLTPPVLIFLQSKERAKELFHELVYDGINVDFMTADRTPDQRERIMQRFRTGDIWVLLCTDLMARGVDFKGVKMVVNYDFPQSAVSYIHRIGRTGRAGRRGTAVTLFTEDDLEMLRSIANVIKLSGCDIPSWMTSMKKLRASDKRKMGVSARRRKGVATISRYDRKLSKKRKHAA